LRTVYKYGNREKYVFDDGKNVGEYPIPGNKSFGQLARIYVNKEGTCQVDHHAKHDPEMIPAVNKKGGYILHLLVQVIEGEYQNTDSLYANRDRVNSTHVYGEIVNQE
jgi:hypothetical protein